ncbi:type II secretion system protein GspK [Maricaulis parjimensis]|uniref:type II secretion system protein GspK n=1 Tax=Maricaulis parjimensis TaxID=144023 RepID=UPI00193A3299|nr:type II secretion system protein GspK [Maricaulis parjimensis]
MIVLWLSLLLSVILLAVTVLVQSQIRVARFEREAAQTREILRSALDIAAFDTALIGRTALAEFPRTISVAGQTVLVDLSPSQTLLDINLANDEDWMALWIRLGESETAARRLADHILDWRDPDTLPRALGFEGSDGDHAPQNRPFVSVEELGRVAGVNPQRLACVRPYVTALGATRMPELDDLQGAEALTMDGMRTVFRARVTGRGGRVESMTGLALFARGQDRPFEWVSFGVDRPLSGSCGEEAMSALDTQPDAWH